MAKKRNLSVPPFDVRAYLDAAGVSPRVARSAPGHVFSLQTGAVKLSVLATTGKEAVVALLGPGEFFGEGVLANQPSRISTARAMAAVSILRIPKGEMIRLLHDQPDFSDRFIAHMLTRNIRIEEDLVDQLFNSSEKRTRRV